MREFKSICIFGASSPGIDDDFKRAAVELGKTLAAKKINVVYGGGVHGLRGCVAGSAFLGGSHVLGVAYKDSTTRNFSNNLTLGNELKVASMHERFGHMFHNADAFIALPGGLETLEGVSCMLFCTKFKCPRKPLGLLNIKGFFDHFLSFLDQAVEHRFIPQATREFILATSTVTELVDQLTDQLQIRTSKSDPSWNDVEVQIIGSSSGSVPDTTLHL